MGTAKPLIIPISATITNTYKNKTQNYSMFNNTGLGIDSTDNLFILWLNAEDYKPTANVENERIQGYLGAMVKLNYIPYAFDAEIMDQRIDVYNVLNDLITESIEDGYYNLITIYDYHSPTNTSAYTLRQGTLEIIPKSGVMVGYNGTYNTGFSLRFEQVDI